MHREVGFFVSTVRVKLHYTSHLTSYRKNDTLNLATMNTMTEFIDTSI